MRALIGRPDAEGWDQPPGRPVFPGLDRAQYRAVLDFGCGCGRLARQLAQARRPMPKQYLGLDLHAGMIKWCAANLAPLLPGFSFEHHDVYNPGLNPDPDLLRTRQFPVADDSVSLLLAVSVFTHLVQPEMEFYLDECARVLAPDGVLVASFFLFEKRYFPMMQGFQNALYINPDDPTNAVIVDREWLLAALEQRSLTVTAAEPP